MVLTIIAILATLVIPFYNEARYAVGDRAAKSDLRNAMNSLELYMARFGSYPGTLAGLTAETGFAASSGVTFTEYKVEAKNGLDSVHMHVQYEGSPNAWHAHYPGEGFEIERRNPKK